MDEVVDVDDNVPDPEEVKAAEERVAEADGESTTDAGSNEVKSDAADLRAELQEQLARLACLDPLAVTPIIS